MLNFPVMVILGLSLYLTQEAQILLTCRDKPAHFEDTDLDGNKTCKPCTVCKAGEEEITKCTHINDAYCSPCKKGYYSKRGDKSCRKCRKGCPRGYRISRKCSKSTDMKCEKCRKGKYYLKKGRCRACSVCRTGTFMESPCSLKKNTRCKSCSVCPTGSYTESPCSSDRDTVCKVCPWGTYSSAENSTLNYCLSCIYCKYGEEMIHRCNSTHNAVCGECQSGFFRLQTTSECVPCSPCIPDKSGNFTNTVEECRKKSTDQSQICMPTAIPWEILISNNLTESRYGFQDNIHKEYVATYSVEGLFQGDAFGTATILVGCFAIFLFLFVSVLLTVAFVKKKFIIHRIRKHSSIKKHTQYFHQENLLKRYIESQTPTRHMTICRSSSVPVQFVCSQYDVTGNGAMCPQKCRSDSGDGLGSEFIEFDVLHGNKNRSRSSSISSVSGLLSVSVTGTASGENKPLDSV